MYSFKIFNQVSYKRVPKHPSSTLEVPFLLGRGPNVIGPAAGTDRIPQSLSNATLTGHLPSRSRTQCYWTGNQPVSQYSTIYYGRRRLVDSVEGN